MGHVIMFQVNQHELPKGLESNQKIYILINPIDICSSMASIGTLVHDH